MLDLHSLMTCLLSNEILEVGSSFPKQLVSWKLRGTPLLGNFDSFSSIDFVILKSLKDKVYLSIDLVIEDSFSLNLGL